MSIFEGLILGVIQGITEFLPISSSGHLILARDVLGIQTEGGLAFDAVLHLATALAVLVYFRREIWAILQGKRKKLLMALIVGTIPAVLVGLLLGDYIESITRSVGVVVWMLVVGSLLFIVAEWVGKNSQKISVKKGIWVGCFQALALAPGISRSGASISGGLLFGLDRETAAKFAFLLSVPILLGVGFLKMFELGSGGLLGSVGVALLSGSVVAFIVGMLAIHFMIRFLRKYPLYIFAVYRILLAVLVLLII